MPTALKAPRAVTTSNMLSKAVFNIILLCECGVAEPERMD